jgi:hypothetical protein
MTPDMSDSAALDREHEAPARRLSHIVGPDFICIGMPKAGTGWLYDQLQYHEDFWMPPVKELHYLNKEVPNMGNFARRLERAQDPKKAARRGKKLAEQHLMPRRRPQNERDTKFLEQAMELSGKPRNMDGYIGLFAYKDGLISGDITPGYTQLEPETIEEIARRLPDSKIVFMVRDPVAREWSHLCMLYRSERKHAFDESQLENADSFREFLKNSMKIQTRIQPSQVYERWQKHAPKMQFRYFLFDQLAAEGDTMRREVITYLGGDPDKPSAILGATYNRKASAPKLPLTDTCKDVLVDYFKDELKACAATFGAQARNWPAQYGL